LFLGLYFGICKVLSLTTTSHLVSIHACSARHDVTKIVCNLVILVWLGSCVRKHYSGNRCASHHIIMKDCVQSWRRRKFHKLFRGALCRAQQRPLIVQRSEPRASAVGSVAAEWAFSVTARVVASG